jgi:hypothetical protein
VFELTYDLFKSDAVDVLDGVAHYFLLIVKSDAVDFLDGATHYFLLIVRLYCSWR